MVVPPGTTLKSNINGLIFAYSRYACEIQKHTKYTLFRVFECLDPEFRHCVCDLAREHISR